jgi:hypothetical protein
MMVYSFNEEAQSRMLVLKGAEIRFVSESPLPSELPPKRLLAYGTSITEGTASTAAHLSYLAQAGRRLGMDVVNLGSSGSAYCEPEMAHYIASRKDWDVCV